MAIVKRSIYYYYKYSFRQNGKVITKEKYLGKNIPKNMEKIKEEVLKESRKGLYFKLEKIKKHFLKEWKRMPKSAKEKERKEIAIAFTYNTNAIEGSKITLEETREITIDQTAPHKSLKDIKETEEHFKIFLEMLENKEKVSKKLILDWHQKMFGNTKKDIAGRYRDFSVRVGSYRAPDWQEIDKLMNAFFRFVNNSQINTVELAARAHYRFEKIHPFGDGNGRIGRLLMNHILWLMDYPLIIIEYKKRKSYYKAFNGGEEKFVKYFFRRYLTVHKRRI